MTDSFFLGANSADGFYSLYGEFCRGERDYLSVIKGGPGTGKSSFMRKIGRRAEELGFDAEYVLCSGDPDSLDGVYIPDLHRGWVDGTAPHVSEPGKFGVDGDYVNLSVFCRTPLESEDACEASALYDAYRARYSKAYAYLKAAKAIRGTETIPLITDIADIFSEAAPGRGSVSKRFLRCISGAGEIVLSEAIRYCSRVLFISDADTAGILEAAKQSREDLIQYLSPLSPENTDAMIIPRRSLAFVNAELNFSKETNASSLASKMKRRKIDKEQKGLMNAAILELSEAKRLHDLLEEVYKKYMDYPALDDFTEKYIDELFDQKTS